MGKSQHYVSDISATKITFEKKRSVPVKHKANEFKSLEPSIGHK